MVGTAQTLPLQSLQSWELRTAISSYTKYILFLYTILVYLSISKYTISIVYAISIYFIYFAVRLTYFGACGAGHRKCLRCAMGCCVVGAGWSRGSCRACRACHAAVGRLCGLSLAAELFLGCLHFFLWFYLLCS